MEECLAFPMPPPDKPGGTSRKEAGSREARMCPPEVTEPPWERPGAAIPPQPHYGGPPEESSLVQEHKAGHQKSLAPITALPCDPRQDPFISESQIPLLSDNLSIYPPPKINKLPHYGFSHYSLRSDSASAICKAVWRQAV